MRKILVGVLAAATLFAACGGDDDDAASSSTIADATTTVGDDPTTVADTSTTAPATTEPAPETTVTGEWADFPCGGEPTLGDTLMTYANENSPTPGVEFLVTDLMIAEADPTWGRGAVSAPPDSGVEGFIAVAHCDASDTSAPEWVIQDLGTSGVGCMPDVPDELGWDC